MAALAEMSRARWPLGLLAAEHEQAEGLLRVEADGAGQRQPLLARAAGADEVADEPVAGRLAGVGGLALEEQDEGRDDTGPLDRALVGVAQRAAPPT